MNNSINKKTKHIRQRARDCLKEIFLSALSFFLVLFIFSSLIHYRNELYPFLSGIASFLSLGGNFWGAFGIGIFANIICCWACSIYIQVINLEYTDPYLDSDKDKGISLILLTTSYIIFVINLFSIFYFLPQNPDDRTAYHLFSIAGYVFSVFPLMGLILACLAKSQQNEE
jgi:hypothetical protein